MFCINSLSFKDNTRTTKWYTKYYNNLVAYIQDFSNHDDYKEWKLRIYLENKLYCFIDELLSVSDRVEIFHMKHDSGYCQPGTLWRFLAFDDKSNDIVYETDVDINFNERINRINSVKNNKKTFSRVVQYYNNNFKIVKNDINSPLNYAVVSGSSIGMRPKLIDISIKDTIINYILYRISRYTSKNPSEEYDDANTQLYNKPRGNCIYGWGGIWTSYGFDEKLFKHTIFPYFIKKGEVLSYCGYKYIDFNSLEDTNPCKMDYLFTTSYQGNIFEFDN